MRSRTASPVASVLVLGSVVCFTLACASRITVPSLAPEEVASVRAAGNYPDENYRVEPGDTLNIRFPYHQEMDLPAVLVSPNGRATVGEFGEMSIAGLTIQQLTGLLVKRSSERLRDPEVVVTVSRFADKPIYVTGEVGKPGAIPYRSGLTPLQAVVASGGFLETARVDSVILVRNGPGGSYVARKLDLDEVVRAGIEEPVALAPHDIIFVPRTPIAEANLWVKQHVTDLIPFVRGFGAAASVP